jgi:hypothetical protein
MKHCPLCKRTYADDSLTFCLDDGSLLSAAFDPLATLQVGDARVTDPPKTEILPPELTPTPIAYPPSPRSQTLQPSKHHVTRWIALSATLAVITIALIGLVVLLALRASNQTSPESRPLVSSAPAPTANSNISATTTSAPNANSANTSSAATNNTPEVKPPADSLEWMNGEWEGRGYQSNTGTNWSLRLAVHNGSYSIEYPSIPCAGRWVLISKSGEGARFTEQITQNVPHCENNSRITVKKLSDSRASCTYFSTHVGAVVATAIINKKRS